MHQVIDKVIMSLYVQIFIYILLCSKKRYLIKNIFTEEKFKIYISDIKTKGKELQKKNRVESKSSVLRTI